MSAAEFDALLPLRVLVRQGVRFVVIGGVAARVWGSPIITNDLDVCYDKRADNLTPLVNALKSLDATLRGAPKGLPFILDERTFKFGDSFTFETTAGALDVLATPSGTTGYDDLASRSSELDIEGMKIRFASLEDLIAMKRAARRAKDLVVGGKMTIPDPAVIGDRLSSTRTHGYAKGAAALCQTLGQAPSADAASNEWRTRSPPCAKASPA